MMKNKYLAVVMWIAAIYIGACALSGCVTGADIRDLGAAIDDLDQGKISKEEAQAEIEAIAERVDERTDAIATAAGEIPTDPWSLLAYLVSIGGTVAGSVYGTNRMRDKKRELRGEPVKTPVKPSSEAS